VSSSDRGDGKDFHSTQLNTVQYDAVANMITITGVGVSAGRTVTFVFTALETGPTTPGWVSFSFSDGYTNAGILLNGSILLHETALVNPNLPLYFLFLVTRLRQLP
jgi:hypothetical protein